jgi:O-antigen biosynthesis protein
MRVCFLLHELGKAGGMGVVTGHAERLRGRGWDAEVVLADAVDDREWDFALATWWETAEALWRVNARRRGMFLQSFEERYYRDDELLERLGAATVLGLPVDYLAVGDWMREVLADVRPDARCVVVRNGIDKDVFRAPGAGPRAARSDGPLRVLVEGNPHMWLKAIDDAVAAVEAMAEPVELTRIDGGRDAAGMAEAYGSHDVLLKLSRVEGVALPPIEAMHCGTPCVVTPHTGHDEYVVHRENGLVVGFDDVPATAAALDELARDRGLLARLSEGALRTAAAWPSAPQSTDALAAALEQLAAAPPPGVAPALAALHARQRLSIELGRSQLGELTWNRRAYEHERDALVRVQAELDDVRAERAYQTAVRARNIVKKVTRR